MQPRYAMLVKWAPYLKPENEAKIPIKPAHHQVNKKKAQANGCEIKRAANLQELKICLLEWGDIAKDSIDWTIKIIFLCVFNTVQLNI